MNFVVVKLYLFPQVTIERPFFYMSGMKVYSASDIPHLFKSIRNVLLKYDIEVVHDGLKRVVSWEVMKKLFEFEQKGRTRVCPKLTVEHINPSLSSKMSVKLATQALSNSVCVGIKTYLDYNYFKADMIQKAKDFMKFSDMANRAFDCLNAQQEIHGGNPIRVHYILDRNHIFS